MGFAVGTYAYDLNRMSSELRCLAMDRLDSRLLMVAGALLSAADLLQTVQREKPTPSSPAEATAPGPPAWVQRMGMTQRDRIVDLEKRLEALEETLGMRAREESHALPTTGSSTQASRSAAEPCPHKEAHQLPYLAWWCPTCETHVEEPEQPTEPTAPPTPPLSLSALPTTPTFLAQYGCSCVPVLAPIAGFERVEREIVYSSKYRLSLKCPTCGAYWEPVSIVAPDAPPTSSTPQNALSDT